MILYKTTHGLVVEHEGKHAPLLEPFLEKLLANQDLDKYLSSALSIASPMPAPDPATLLAPIDQQEVWAAGVTYFRSRSARIEESKDAGGGDFYDRVYSADRPELFFKSQPHKVAGPNQNVRIRSDAHWSVPEPELALVLNPAGEIIGYTIGNDMSSRDIEGANPLYLPQAKVYDQSCALGPGILLQKMPLPPSTQISLEIHRADRIEFHGSTDLFAMKRDPKTLAEYLFRDQSFPHGAILLTGTGIIPPDNFSLQSGDEIRISITDIGTLINKVG